MTANPLSEIKEENAVGRVAALYDDIRAVIGVPIVNLIFRNMATVPGCLDWTWETIRPLYISGKIPKAAVSLTADVLPGQLADLSKPIKAARLTDGDVAAIDLVLDTYGRANPMNAVGLQIIHYALENTEQSKGIGRANPLADGLLLKPSGLKALLPMTDLATAPEDVQSALHRLACQIHGGDTGVIPSLYRHFGAWPAFLETLEETLESALCGGIENAASDMLESSKVLALELYKDLPLQETVPGPEGLSTLKKLIEQFPINICRMTVLATLLRRGLPRQIT